MGSFNAMKSPEEDQISLFQDDAREFGFYVERNMLKSLNEHIEQVDGSGSEVCELSRLLRLLSSGES